VDPERLELMETLRRFTAAVEELGIRLEAAYLFGSHATGTANEYSDFDVALVSGDFERGSMDQWIRIMRLCRTIDSRLEPVLYRPEEFRDEEPLAWQIKTSGHRLPLH
jgi:predicted nucleotidyltransferase